MEFKIKKAKCKNGGYIYRFDNPMYFVKHSHLDNDLKLAQFLVINSIKQQYHSLSQGVKIEFVEVEEEEL